MEDAAIDGTRYSSSQELRGKSYRGLRGYGYGGIGLILLAEISIIFGWDVLSTWVTPFCWTGYILLLDSVVLKLRGRSLMTTDTAAFWWMWPLSVAFWLIFEGYNLRIDNWYYINMPPHAWVTWFGKTWAFATIMPGIFETAEFLVALGVFRRFMMRPKRIRPWLLRTYLGMGIVFAIVPLVTPRTIAHYMAIPVWGAFIFLLDPFLYRKGRPSMLGDWSCGRVDRFLTILTAGLICGMLWEFWNFWAHTKWIYEVPFLGHLKIFEMPIIGWLGFPPFAVELFCMYSFVAMIGKRLRIWTFAFTEP
jgi:hypothetical protein